MEIKQLVDQLLSSGIMENQELALTVLRSSEVNEEEKQRYIDDFIRQYTEGDVNFFSEDHKDLFKNWVELYTTTLKARINNDKGQKDSN